MSTHVLKSIRLEELFPSPTNPRKTFDDLKLQEMSRSIREVGILEPLLVRAHVNGKTTYEVVAGERRYRAAKIAEAGEVPCIVRELTDVQVLEIQTIENLQRDDLHPLEEAAGYAALMKEAGYDVDRIAERISKSAKYVYDRIKLLQLIKPLQKVFLDGEITASHAILLARLSKADQERLHGEGEPDGSPYQLRGLWQEEDAEPGLDLDDKVSRKPISVRELERFIDDHVRFRPEEVDLPNLFPATAAALAAAKEEELKVVKITRDYRVNDDARDEKEKTYGEQAWKRADGQVDVGRYGKAKRSKTCEHSVLGVVVSGFGRGEAFKVCVAKKKCTVHWAAEQKAANERGAPNGAGTKKGKAAAQDTWQQQEARRRKQEEEAKAERARWKKAAPQLISALVAQVTAAPIEDLVDVVVASCKGWGPPSKAMARGKTVEDGVRYAAFLDLSSDFSSEWHFRDAATKALKRFGVDAKKIVDEVAPKPPPEKKPKPAPAAKKKGAKKKAGR